MTKKFIGFFLLIPALVMYLFLINYAFKIHATLGILIAMIPTVPMAVFGWFLLTDKEE